MPRNLFGCPGLPVERSTWLGNDGAAPARVKGSGQAFLGIRFACFKISLQPVCTYPHAALAMLPRVRTAFSASFILVWSTLFSSLNDVQQVLAWKTLLISQHGAQTRVLAACLLTAPQVPPCPRLPRCSRVQRRSQLCSRLCCTTRARRVACRIRSSRSALALCVESRDGCACVWWGSCSGGSQAVPRSSKSAGLGTGGGTPVR